jgi:hypothetical protein
MVSSWNSNPSRQKSRAITKLEELYPGFSSLEKPAGGRPRHERYEEFCEWRAARLAEALSEFPGID